MLFRQMSRRASSERQVLRVVTPLVVSLLSCPCVSLRAALGPITLCGGMALETEGELEDDGR